MRPFLFSPLLLALTVPAGGAVAATPAAHAPARQVLPFIEDDYARALSEARSRKLPLFIEAWAPW